MGLTPTGGVVQVRERMEGLLDEHFYPVELEALQALDEEVGPGTPYPRILVEMRERAKAEGLWNLFLPDDDHGAGLTNWEHGMLCEVMGRSVLAGIAFNCAAPDTRN